MSETKAKGLYAGVGEELTHYELDVAGAALLKKSSVTLPANVQYVWPHPSRRYLYVTTSDRVRGQEGEKHDLVTFRIADDGSLEQVGTPMRLPHRPIHVTVDAAGKRLAVSFNGAGVKRGPGTALLYRIRDDGASVEPAPSHPAVDAGMYPHQARFTPDDSKLLVCARGNNASAGHGEDPGALKIFDTRNDALTLASEVPYPAGLGPRHLDIHPDKRWVYVSMERGNKLCMHRMDAEGNIQPAIVHTKSTLADEASGQRKRQLAGTLHVHPAGTHVYVANRADGTIDDVFEGGENNIAVYRIDAQTGEPTLVQHEDTRGMHPRTFALDPSGRVMVVAHVLSRRRRDGDSITNVPVTLSVFRVNDGKPEYVRKYDIETGKKTLFWMGII
ncbi:MAG TPA: beta-propeller fold lactonase family protein [Burkholderiales bacterium]|nr:beta-propeller fold lactonase family protein [Burkholderiales bacterium]